MKQLAMPFELDAFGGKGIPFKVERTSIKFLPVMYSLQLPVSMALELRRKVKIEDIDSISVYLGKRSVTGGSYAAERYAPANRETADHSGPYLIGAALVEGEVTIRTLTPERYLDPTVLALTKKICAVEDPEYTAASPRTLNCRMEATLRSGQKVIVHQSNSKGHPSNPMSDAEIEDKFLKQAEPFFAGGRSRALLGSAVGPGKAGQPRPGLQSVASVELTVHTPRQPRPRHPTPLPLTDLSRRIPWQARTGLPPPVAFDKFP